MANDLTLINDAFKIGPVYLGKIRFLALLVLLGFLVLFVLAVGFRAVKVHMDRGDYFHAFFVNVAFCVGLILLDAAGRSFSILPRHYSNVDLACEKYGYVYCFCTSFLGQGIGKPEEYTDELVEKIIEDGDASAPAEEDYPNIIFLQLESFMDPNLIRGVEYNRNPTDYFEWLVENFPSGYLTVPAFGAGTANTEFEVMTAMNLDDFGLGEYPHKSILKTNTCESAAYVLKELGYTAHAIHNNDGTFYGRNLVFKNLGFDIFTSIEYMSGYEQNPIGWAKDSVLVEQINKALDFTPGKDYIYAISVQGHGDYPDNLEGIDIDLYEKGFFAEEEEQQFVYYINQLEEVDEFLENLTKSLSEREENTVLVLFGDHLPGFSFEEDNLCNGDLYQTQYVIWSKEPLLCPNRDLAAFQLYPWVLEKIGISNGILNRYHQNRREREDYLELLTVLEYDMLYGEGVVYKSHERYESTDMKMGLDDIKVTYGYNFENHVCVEGTNFNAHSAVSVNGKVYDAVCVNSHTLYVEGLQFVEGDEITVAQRGTDKIVLGESEVYVYTGKENP